MRITRTSALVTLASATALLLAACSSTASGTGASTSDDDAAASKPPLFSKLPKEIQQKGELIFGGDTHPPYRSVADDGKVTGIDPDFQAALEKELGVTIKTEITSGLDAILSGMLSGRYDAFNGPVKATPERQEQFDAVVWMTTRSSYVFTEENAGKIPDSSALCGLKIAGVQGSVTEDQVAKLSDWCKDNGKKPAAFTGLADTNATILAVQSGRVDALATTQAAAIDIINQTPDTFGYVTQTDAQGAGVDQMAMLTSKDDGLGQVLYEAVQQMFEDGSYSDLMSKWKLDDVAVDEPTLNPEG